MERKHRLKSAFAEERNGYIRLTPEAQDAVSNVDGALVWEIVGAGHHLKMKVGDALSSVEDFFKWKEERFVCGNKENRKARWEAV